ncbi:unnamed protein product, partial [Allacma fusca]
MTSFPAVYEGVASHSFDSYIVRLESPPGTCRCTAALLTTFVALTSAHCIIGLSPVNMSIASHEMYENVKNQAHNVKQVIIHDNFIEGTFENDIALLVLTEGLDIHREEFSVSLPKRNTNYTDTGVFVNWAKRNAPLETFTTNYFLSGKLTFRFENHVCKNAYPNITDKHMCAATRGRCYLNDCDGFLISFDKYREFYLCGIISIGNNYSQKYPRNHTIWSSAGWDLFFLAQCRPWDA